MTPYPAVEAQNRQKARRELWLWLARHPALFTATFAASLLA